MELETVHKKHDRCLRKIFAEPNMMNALVSLIDWDDLSSILDFSKMQTIKAAHIAPNLRAREGDCVWKIPALQNQGDVIVLIEFQRTVDDFMPLRVSTYAHLIYEDQSLNEANIIDGKLPPIIGIVLYIGNRKWNVPTTLKDCINSKISNNLHNKQPNMEYFFIDISKIDLQAHNIPSNNPLLSIAAIYNLSKPSEYDCLFKFVDSNLKGQPVSLRKAFRIFAATVMELTPDLINTEEQFEGEEPMLQEHYKSFVEHFRDEGKAEGIAEGKAEGIAEGKAKGKAEERQAHLKRQRDFMIQVLQSLYKDGIPEVFRQKLENASIDELYRWCEQIIQDKIAASEEVIRDKDL